MGKRVCVFVDGENLRHSIVEAFKDQGLFERHWYLPKWADWAEFYDWIVDQIAGSGGSRLRTYWYVIDDLAYWPFALKDLNRPGREPKAREILGKNRPFRSELSGLTNAMASEKVREKISELLEEQQKMSSRLEEWKSKQDDIAKKHRSIEFRRAGVMSYNLFDKKLGREKAVDVKLACDMLMLRKIYDVAIIVSGDQDYVPAVEVVKDSGKEVFNVAFKKMNGTLIPGGARQLNIKTDDSFGVPYDDLKRHMGL